MWENAWILKFCRWVFQMSFEGGLLPLQKHILNEGVIDPLFNSHEVHIKTIQREQFSGISTFVMLCICHLCLVPTFSSVWKKNPYPLNIFSPLHPFPCALETTSLHSVSMCLSVLNTSYTLNNAVYGLMWTLFAFKYGNKWIPLENLIKTMNTSYKTYIGTKSVYNWRDSQISWSKLLRSRLKIPDLASETLGS